ncbi:hypothetical protein [Bradyrhizobium mercantei]|uniref:hypothetical protein n=1 Tax=Bradyrhizobium mercantei TaxID=1904807 RepID=UPI0011775B01|nr:hypothetical protein [Bradyrhizobium mercantei]
MSLITPILDGAARAAEALGDLLTSLLTAIDPGTGGFDEGADGGLGMVMAGLAGVAAALLVAILLSVYFRGFYRSTHDIVTHSFATALVLGLLGFAVYDMRQDMRDYFGLSAAPSDTGTNLPSTGLLGSRRSPPVVPAPAIKPLAIKGSFKQDIKQPIKQGIEEDDENVIVPTPRRPMFQAKGAMQCPSFA